MLILVPDRARGLGVFDASMLVMGGVVGVGIFFTPGRVAAYVPDATLFLGLWVLGGAIALCGAGTFAELAGTFPRTGGWFVYLREAFGRFPAFLFAWIVLFVVSTGAVAVVADFCVHQASVALRGSGADALAAGEARWAAGGLVAGLTVVALLGVRASSRLQSVTMVAKLGAVAVLVGASLLVLGGGGGAEAVPVREASAFSWGNGVQGLLSALFAYGGWQLVTYIASDVRDPERNAPRALWWGMSAVVLTYLAFNACALGVLGIDGLAGSNAFAADWAEATLGAWGGTFVAGVMALSAFGTCAAILLASPGLYVAMAREGLFFRVFGELNARQAPVAALLLQGVVTLAYVSWGEAGDLIESVVFAEWVFHFLAGAALLSIRVRRPDLPRPFRSPAYPLMPLVYAGCALVVVVLSLSETELAVTGPGLVWIAVGSVVYPLWRRWF